jgi:hypothetical protein
MKLMMMMVGVSLVLGWNTGVATKKAMEEGREKKIGITQSASKH